MSATDKAALYACFKQATWREIIDILESATHYETKEPELIDALYKAAVEWRKDEKNND